MGKLFVAILKSENTAAIRAKATFINELEYMEVSALNNAAVAELLTEIDDDNWTSSGTVIGESGEQVRIRLPKEAIKA